MYGKIIAKTTPFCIYPCPLMKQSAALIHSNVMKENSGCWSPVKAMPKKD